MRALLIVNPRATSTTRRARDVIGHALAESLRLDTVETRWRGHAVTLARKAAVDGYDVVVALGGDGTVNETVNGLLADGVRPGLPALAPIAGGSANVFTRALGLPNDPVEGTGAVLEALRENRRRRVGLGRADDRYFTFCAGLGLDAEVIRAVEAQRADGRRSGPSLYVLTAARQFLTVTDRRHPALTLEIPGRPAIEGLFLTVISNTAPWTYLGDRPVNPSPRASFTSGLDVFALRRLRLVPTLWLLRALLVAAAGPPRGRDVVGLHDEGGFTVTSRRPIAFQVDGEYLGERERVGFVAVPDALQVVA